VSGLDFFGAWEIGDSAANFQDPALSAGLRFNLLIAASRSFSASSYRPLSFVSWVDDEDGRGDRESLSQAADLSNVELAFAEKSPITVTICNHLHSEIRLWLQLELSVLSPRGKLRT
jgi:hypothetical protein